MARERKSGRVAAAVALVVHPDGKVAAMRAKGRCGKLSLLGGTVEPGEDPARAAMREAEEESGGSLRVSRVRLLGIWPADDTGRPVAGYLATAWWVVDPTLGDVRPVPRERVELRGSEEGPALWVPEGDLLDPSRSAFPAWSRELLAAYAAWLRLPAAPVLG